ncbi:hypothetical protein C8Q74DRAFT_1217832 [Fomes fomentarius]|nr:hypothetical protein C8Q74DRAFT_1217832 [Fomes fomentarius]
MIREEEHALLFEFERDEKGRIRLDADGCWKFTERAQQAQEASIASTANPHPPKLLYGWAYRYGFLKAYASKYQLNIRIYGDFAHRHGKDFVIYGQPTEAELQDEALQRSLQDMLQCVVRVGLLEATPFTDKYDGMFVLWDNYDIEERHDDIEEDGSDVEEVVLILQRAMSELRPAFPLRSNALSNSTAIRQDLTTAI